MLAFLFAFSVVIVAAGMFDRSRGRRSRMRQTPHGFAVVDALVVGLMLSITAAVLILAIANIRSV